MVFSLNGMSLKHYASQGQHKTFLVALKVAEFFYLKRTMQRNTGVPAG
jgi:DNA replication and repair protein RecF